MKPTIDNDCTPAASRQARSEPWCRGCGGDKDIGALVCWDCFKDHPSIPLKYSGTDYIGWLRAVGGELRGLDTTERA